MKSAPEVRYHMLRPAEIVARRKEAPVAYIPVGTLEWHGPHNPVGADTLQAEGLGILAARKGGGLKPLIGVSGAMPPQDATAEFGATTLEASAEIVVREVRHRLENREIYQNHGMSLVEGLWREQPAG